MSSLLQPYLFSLILIVTLIIVLMIIIMIIIIIIIIITIIIKRKKKRNKKKATEIIIVDIAVPGVSNVLQKEIEKYEKYQDLAREIKRIWKSRTKVLPVIVGALRLVSKKLAGQLEQLGIKDRTRTMQKSALLGSAHILRKVLNV